MSCRRHACLYSDSLPRGIVLSTRLDLLRDLNSQLQRRSGLRTGNARLAPRGCTFYERRELKLERFAVFDPDPVTPNLFSDAAIDLAALILIIERQIRVFLKNPDLTHPLGADEAAGRRQFREFRGMCSVVGDRFLDQHVFALGEESACNVVMSVGRRCYRSGVNDSHEIVK